MTKKRLFYIIGGVASALYGILSLVTGGWSSIIALIVWIAMGAFLIVSAFVPKFPRVIPAVVMFVMAGFTLLGAIGVFVSNVFTIIANAIDYGFIWENLVITLVQAVVYILLFVGFLLGGLYMVLTKKMKKAFPVAGIVFVVEGILNTILFILVHVLNKYPGEVIVSMFFREQLATIIATIMLAAMAVFMCLARKIEFEEAEAEAALAAAEAEVQTAEATEKKEGEATAEGEAAPAAASAAPNVTPNPTAAPDPAQAARPVMAQPVATEVPYSVLPTDGGAFNVILHGVLLFFVGFIWQPIWIYRVTKWLNCDKNAKDRSPILQALLCYFIPFYHIYWLYQTCKSVERLGEERKMEDTDITFMCMMCIIGGWVLSVGVFSWIPYVIVQHRINEICEKPVPPAPKPVYAQPVYAQPVYAQPVAQQPVYARPVQPVAPAQDKATELKKYKELLDSGAITQEEYDAMKKKLLGL